MTDLLISLRELPVKLGESQRIRLQFVPDDDWAAGVMRVKGDTPIEIGVSLTSVDGGVLASIQGECTLLGECVRCLEPIEKLVQIDVTGMFFDSPQTVSSQVGQTTGLGSSGGEAPRTTKSRNRTLVGQQNSHDIEVEGDELDAPYLIERNQIDLEPLLRDEILVQSDYQPLCQSDCQGLCAHCGIKLAEAPKDHHHEFVNPSFAALEGFFERNNAD